MSYCPVSSSSTEAMSRELCSMAHQRLRAGPVADAKARLQSVTTILPKWPAACMWW